MATGAQRMQRQGRECKRIETDCLETAPRGRSFKEPWSRKEKNRQHLPMPLNPWMPQLQFGGTLSRAAAAAAWPLVAACMSGRPPRTSSVTSRSAPSRARVLITAAWPSCEAVRISSVAASCRKWRKSMHDRCPAKSGGKMTTPLPRGYNSILLPHVQPGCNRTAAAAMDTDGLDIKTRRMWVEGQHR